MCDSIGPMMACRLLHSGIAAAAAPATIETATAPCPGTRRANTQNFTRSPLTNATCRFVDDALPMFEIAAILR